jgi:peptide/nickel transport system permease protein
VILLIPTLILVTLIVFFIVRLMPGSVIDQMLAEMGQATSSAQIDRGNLEHALGLDVPIHIQYARWISDIFLHGNLGRSLRSDRLATDEMAHRLPVTFELGLLAVLISNAIAIPVGIYSAIRQDAWLDYIGRSVSILALAVPGFWLATMLIVYGSTWWNWSPSPQYIPFSQNPIENLKIIIVPAIILGTNMSGGTMRYTRTLMLEVLRQDYVRTAWSKGLRERVIVLRHALRNSLIPLVTILAPEIGMLIGGAVIMEQIFCLPGMGRYLLTMVTERDYLIVSGTNLVFAGFTMFLVLATDLSYAFLDPRVRYK